MLVVQRDLGDCAELSTLGADIVGEVEDEARVGVQLLHCEHVLDHDHLLVLGPLALQLVRLPLEEPLLGLLGLLQLLLGQFLGLQLGVVLALAAGGE